MRHAIVYIVPAGIRSGDFTRPARFDTRLPKTHSRPNNADTTLHHTYLTLPGSPTQIPLGCCFLGFPV